MSVIEICPVSVRLFDDYKSKSKFNLFYFFFCYNFRMKELPRNKNVYIQNGKYYVDYWIDGLRFRKATGLKVSATALKFIIKNYELFKGNKEQRAFAKNKFIEIEDNKFINELIKKENKIKVPNNNEFSFEFIINSILREKSYLKDKTIRLYRSISDFIFAFLKKYNLVYVFDFERSHSIDFITFCKNNNFNNKSILLYCSFFKGIFRYALSNNLIDSNPFIVPNFKQNLQQNNKDIEPFSLDEIELLIKNSHGNLRTYLIIAFFTGARIGEIMALTFGDIDFEKRTILINKSTSEFGITDAPKTISSNRKIDMLDVVYKELVALKCCDKTQKIINLSRFLIKRDFDALQKELGFKVRKLYDTRHSFASVMLSRGEEPMWVGCKMMGHKNLNETFKSYAKYLPKEVKGRAIFLNDIDI